MPKLIVDRPTVAKQDRIDSTLITDLRRKANLPVGEYDLNSYEEEKGNYTKVSFKDYLETFKYWYVYDEHTQVVDDKVAVASLDVEEDRPTSVIVYGEKTGNSMKLPTGKLVYANECIVEGIPLTWGECTKSCTRKPLHREEVVNAINLTKVFGRIRDKFDSPIAVTSGYRPPEVNRAVGGASKSQHVYFKALDIFPLDGNFKKLYQCILASNATGVGDGVDSGKNFYHFDTRDGVRVLFGY